MIGKLHLADSEGAKVGRDILLQQLLDRLIRAGIRDAGSLYRLLLDADHDAKRAVHDETQFNGARAAYAELDEIARAANRLSGAMLLDFIMGRTPQAGTDNLEIGDKDIPI